MFGGFCLLFVFLLHSGTPVLGVWLFCQICFLVLGQIVLIRIPSARERMGFCLESLILAQDERWRRA